MGFVINKILDIPFFYKLVQLILGMDFFKVSSAYVKKFPHESILEIGCGPEGMIQFLSPKKYLGIDINEKYILYAKQKYETKNIKFLKLDAREVDSIKDSFDLILISQVTHHLSDKDIFMITKKIISSIRFRHLIVIDGKPDIGPFSILLEKADQGGHFRDLQELVKLFEKNFFIEKAEIIRKPYWIYKCPIIVAKRK